MANNRMFLVHRPTGKAAYLGKRLGEGYYTHDPSKISDGLMEFYGHLEKYNFGTLEDLVVAFECQPDYSDHRAPEIDYTNEDIDGWTLCVKFVDSRVQLTQVI